MSLERAYTILKADDVKEEGGFYVVEGIASTPTPDRSMDIVEPMGAVFKTPMPLIWQHNHEKPVGNVIFAKPNKSGIPFRAEIPKVKEEGALKDRIDEAVQSLKYKLVSAVSIGFKALEYAFLENGGIHFTSWEWLELSLVTIPAQPEAKIEVIKSIDRQALAALGKNAPATFAQPSGVSEVRKFKKPIQLIKRVHK